MFRRLCCTSYNIYLPYRTLTMADTMAAGVNCSALELLSTIDPLSAHNLSALCPNTSAPPPSLPSGPIPMSRIIFCAILFFVVVMTLLGNLVVILAFVYDKRLTANNHFNYYIINLAVTDLLVAVMAMSFYTFDVLLGYWPFGEFMCGIWIFFDYGMTFASVFTLVAISADRYWSVAWYLHYRNHNSRKKTVIAIVIVW